MAWEIERKFLVKDLNFLNTLTKGQKIQQGYLSLTENNIRIRTKNNQAYITVKKPFKGFTKYEFEYAIPFEDAQTMLRNICIKPLIEKTRFTFNNQGHTWEIDVFEGVFEGVVVAEIELKSEDEQFEIPYWIGKEVTDDRSYYNIEMVKAYIAQHDEKK